MRMVSQSSILEPPESPHIHIFPYTRARLNRYPRTRCGGISLSLSISATALARKRGECRCVVLWLASVLRLSPGSRSWSWSWVLGGWCFSRAIPSPYLRVPDIFLLVFPFSCHLSKGLGAGFSPGSQSWSWSWVLGCWCFFRDMQPLYSKYPA